jgi:glycosyltransferase involved in cell wall biosynthesis
MDGRRTGVEEYTLNLLLNLFEMDQENEYVLFYNSWKRPRFDFSIFTKFPNVTLKRFRIPNKILNFSFWYLGWPHIDKLAGPPRVDKRSPRVEAGGADVVFLSNIIFGAVSEKTKLIVTIHDLSFERYPEHFSAKRRLWHMFINPKKICRRADKIIAVSESTKNDVVALYKIPSKKVEVIYSAVDEKFRIISRNDQKLLEVKEKYRLPYKFILYLGTIEPRKNIIGIIRAFDELQLEAHKAGNMDILKYKLIIAGAKGWLSQEIFQEKRKAQFRDHIQRIRFVRDEDKEYVYNLASLFVYPSFFEGFGFPPLEAMRCGVPVIASNNSSLPEIVGDGGILVDPDKPEEIFRAMKEVVNNHKLRETLIKKGLEKSTEFDWKKTAQETLKIIKCG